jgi:ABC-type glutathione transport system ATPase component
MLELKARLGLAYLIISHDLAVVAHVADRVSVLCEGRIVEEGDTDAVLRRPRHAYTQRLLRATLPADPARARDRLLAAAEPGPS